jgi:hypothetical protein
MALYTYDSIKTEIQNRLSLLSNWQKTLFLGVYESIIDAVSYAIDKRCLYPAEVYYRESNISTATQYVTIMPLADALSYTPFRKNGAYGYVQLSADSTFSGSYVYAGSTVVIDRWTEFTDSTGSINTYCTDKTIYYALTSGNLNISVKEGIPKEFLYIANGSVNETITIYSDSIDNEEIDVYIVDANNEILYTVLKCGVDVVERKLFYLNDLTNYYCQIDNDASFEKINIIFGNGISTNKLNSGDRILIKYAETKGDLGNIESTAVISKIKNTLYDINGNKVTLYVTNQDSITDGTDIESIESIKYNAVNLFQTGYRCGGYTDWVEILQAHPMIEKAIIWSTDDVADDTLTANQNKIYVTAITTTGTELTTAEKADITINYLKDKKSPCEVVAWQSLNIIYAVFRVTGKVENLSIPVISTQINDSLEAAYYILNTDFKVDIYESNFTSLIDQNDYVLHHNTEIYNMEKGFGYNTLNYVLATSVVAADQSDLTQQIYLVPDTLEIWIRINTPPSVPITAAPTKIAYDSGGVIIASDNTYVDILLGSSKLGTSSTGLANNATVYTASTTISGTPTAISITGSSAQTISDLVTEINTDIASADGLAVFNDGDDFIRIYVTTLGSTTITFTDTNLVSSLFGGAEATIGVPINGFKYTLGSVDPIEYATNTIEFNITELSIIPPDQFELVIMYKTQDGEGAQRNDLRLPAFNYITSIDQNYNQFDLEY